MIIVSTLGTGGRDGQTIIIRRIRVDGRDKRYICWLRYDQTWIVGLRRQALVAS